MRVAVIGSGYVGTVVAACLAERGHRVTGVERDALKLSVLRAGEAPFYEADLPGLIARNLRNGRLDFTSDVDSGVHDAEVVFLCVGTPPDAHGAPDLSAVMTAARSVVESVDADCVLVTKSTVPIGTARALQDLVASRPAGASGRIGVVANPEFLRQGHAVADFLAPDRIVIGGGDEWAVHRVEALYRPITERSNTPVVVTDPETAEMIKYASNAFLAAKVSFINEIARICDPMGADVEVVARGVGLDPRIGPSFLQAGIGWGGSCFGKDLDALRLAGAQAGISTPLLDAARATNVGQRRLVVDLLADRLGDLRGRRVALLGLAFKPGTDDLRDAPSLDIARALIDRGADVTAHDPAVSTVPLSHLLTLPSPFAAAKGADAVVLVTEWPEYRTLDLAALAEIMDGRLLVDGRNIVDPERAEAAGLEHVGIGRGMRHRLRPGR